MNKLPIEIINNIISYTYNFQNKNLLEDIKNYRVTKERISQLYHKIYIINQGLSEPSDKHWLINNILMHINDYQPSKLGYTDNFMNIMFRNINIHIKNTEKIETFINKLFKKNVNSQINVLWGLLTSEERKFIIIKKEFTL
jgi:hypothetical protein